MDYNFIYWTSNSSSTIYPNSFSVGAHKFFVHLLQHTPLIFVLHLFTNFCSSFLHTFNRLIIRNSKYSLPLRVTVICFENTGAPFTTCWNLTYEATDVSVVEIYCKSERSAFNPYCAAFSFKYSVAFFWRISF